MSNPESILKSRNITYAEKGPYSQYYGLSNSHIQMWELDHKVGWHQRIDAFKLWCWRRLMRVSWTARRWTQSILKEINPEHSLEGLRLKLKFQYFGHLIQRADPLEKTVMLGKEVTEDETVGSKSWALKNWWFWIVVLEKTLESPLDSDEIKPVNPKGNQPWTFTGRTDAEAAAPIL